MPTQENPSSGQGPVVLDIGGDIGALIVTMPPEMEDLEVEIVPVGTDSRSAAGSSDHGLDHGHDHDHADGHAHDHGLPGASPPHVAVVARTAPDGTVVHSLVYGELQHGTYDLYVRPDGPVRLTAVVAGGQVSEYAWPQG